MKKLLVFILCVLLMCATPIVAFAEGDSADVVETEGVAEDNSATTEDAPTESEIQPPADTPEEETDFEAMKNLVSKKIEEWILPHLEEISVIVTLILSSFYQMRKHKLLNKSMGTLNNNAITVAKESSNFMASALSNIESASGAVVGYDAKIAALLEAFKQTAEDKLKLERELVEIKNYLKTSTDANVEFANELADLLALANIPNYKKEELGARHLTAVNAIIEAEAKAEAVDLLPANTEEVKEDVGEKTDN
jgi:hypothetical protein